LNPDREKEQVSETGHMLVSANGVQVWTDNMFSDEAIEDLQTDIQEIESNHPLVDSEKRNTH
jgi:hypothetical protein